MQRYYSYLIITIHKAFKIKHIFLFLSGNLTKHMKSKAHGKKCQAMGVSESSVEEPDTEEPGSVSIYSIYSF